MNVVMDATLSSNITFLSVTFFILFGKGPVLPSYLVVAMVNYKLSRISLINFQTQSFSKIGLL